jgi:hypothetical protein
MTSASKTRRNRRNNNRSGQMTSLQGNSLRNKPLTEADLFSRRVALPANPPTYIGNPQTKRTVRFNIPYTGAVITYNIAASTLASQDATDYTGTSTARYQFLQPLLIRAWLSITNSAAASPPILYLSDSLSDLSYTDQAGEGVDWAKVACVPNISTRMTVQPVTNTTNIWQVTVAAVEGCVGNLVIDCDFVAR